MSASANPFCGIESPFFWPVGLALRLGGEALETTGKSVKFFQEIVKNDVIRPKPEWVTPNTIRCVLNTFTLRDFSAEHYRKDEIPTLVLPPYAGHLSTIADFDKRQSLIETLRKMALSRVYCVDWHSATDETKNFDVDSYLSELLVAVGHLGGRVNLVGLCQGGWMAAIYAARFPEQVAALVCAGAPLDTQAGNGAIRDLANALPMSFYESLVAAGGGVMKGEFMLEGFKGMHPEQHMINKYLALYQHIDDPKYLERTEAFERWYQNTLDLPGRWYLQVIEQLFKENKFARGEFSALGQTVGLRNVACPVYLLAGSTDDITPKEQVFNAASYLGTPSEKIAKDLAQGGHIGLFMGSRALQENWPKIAGWITRQNLR
jgi:polyhydroxyalkanoate depolymerase